MANKKYKLTDGNMWATDGIHDFGQNKTQRTINSEVNSALGGKAPTNHASTATTYGAASTSNYGHVKLSNTTPSMDGTAAVGDSTDVARANHVHPSDTSRVPTSRKVNNKQLSSDITLAASDVGAAPTDHASTATTYGKGTSSNYGHVKISDSLTDTTTAATGGVVPSMKAVSDLNGAISNEATARANADTTIENSIAIVSNNNTHIAITKGEYVYVKNHGSLSEGLYIANSNISANDTLTNSNLTALPKGGLNLLSLPIQKEYLTKELSAATEASMGTVSLSAGKWVIFTFTGVNTSVDAVIYNKISYSGGNRSFRGNGRNGGGHIGELIVDLSATTTVTFYGYSPQATTMVTSVDIMKIG